MNHQPTKKNKTSKINTNKKISRVRARIYVWVNTGKETDTDTDTPRDTGERTLHLLFTCRGGGER